MINLLNKQQTFIINEAAVDWSDSALGSATSGISKGVGKTLSWITGSIKKGINTQQINALVKQWGLEYMRAIKAVDTGTTDNNNNSEADSTPQDNEQQNLSNEEKHKLIQVLEEEKNNLSNQMDLITDFSKLNNFDLQNIAFMDFKKDILKFEKVVSKNLSIALESIKLDDDDAENIKIEKLESIFSSIFSFITNISNSENVNEFINHLKGIDKFSTKLINIAKPIEQLISVYDLVIEKLNEKSEEEESKSKKKGFLNLFKKNEMLFINEGLFDKSPTELISKEQLANLIQIDGIIQKTKAELNYVELNRIKYEANYIIQKAKNNKKDNSQELQRTFDMGVLKLNNYFQKVIDIDYVSKTVTGQVDAQVKNRIENDQSSITEIQQLGFDSVMPVGQSFDIKKIYGFQVILTSYNGKTKKHNFLMSPTVDYKQKIGDNQTYWFKLLGSYDVDKKSKSVERINPFFNATVNKSMISNFKNVENAYYIVLDSLQPNSTSNMFVYSNTGKYFLNDNVYRTVSEVKSELQKIEGKNLQDKISNLMKSSNIFKLKNIQRFTISDETITSGKYPGVQLTDGTQDKNVKVAKNNHKELINILSQK